MVWVQQHRNPSFSQILLERYPALGQRQWGGPPSRSLAALPTPVCGEEFGVRGADPWQIHHYSTTSETLSFYSDHLPKRFPLSDLISPPTTRSPVWFCPWASFPSIIPRCKACLWGGLRGCVSSPGCSLLWWNPLPFAPAPSSTWGATSTSLYSPAEMVPSGAPLCSGPASCRKLFLRPSDLAHGPSALFSLCLFVQCLAPYLLSPSRCDHLPTGK